MYTTLHSTEDGRKEGTVKQENAEFHTFLYLL